MMSLYKGLTLFTKRTKRMIRRRLPDLLDGARAGSLEPLDVRVELGDLAVELFDLVLVAGRLLLVVAGSAAAQQN